MPPSTKKVSSPATCQDVISDQLLLERITFGTLNGSLEDLEDELSKMATWVSVLVIHTDTSLNTFWSNLGLHKLCIGLGLRIGFFRGLLREYDLLLDALKTCSKNIRVL